MHDRPAAPADLLPDGDVHGDVAHNGGSRHHQSVPLHSRLQGPEAILRGLIVMKIIIIIMMMMRIIIMYSFVCYCSRFERIGHHLSLIHI